MPLYRVQITRKREFESDFILNATEAQVESLDIHPGNPLLDSLNCGLVGSTFPLEFDLEELSEEEIPKDPFLSFDPDGEPVLILPTPIFSEYDPTGLLPFVVNDESRPLKVQFNG